MIETGSRFTHRPYFGKKVLESLSRLSDNDSKLATHKMLGHDMPRVKLNMICTARFGLIPGVETEHG